MTITLQAVNELIQSLENAGELSIKERKYLEALKEFRLCSVSLDVAVKVANDFDRVIMECRKITGCPAGVDLQGHLQQLAAENVAMRETIEAVRGVADNSRGIAGWHLNGEIAQWSEILPEIDAIETPATDRIVAGIKADGVESFVAYCGEENSVFVEAKAYYRSLPDAAYEFSSMLREGADK
ncbi:hypothetical protein [Klebsiella michiganensis]|uniref:hypothetical protein n=1 Tax=Klebsiella michiganensis TaxID=1134687 RepID=UPI00217F33DE|nr:hypothetical protein [Klebsiella michiganensis]